MRNFNQEKYTESSAHYEGIKLNSTMFLAYRDLKSILNKYFSGKAQMKSIRLLDYGCGPGTSTEIALAALNELGLTVEVHGVDINEENLSLARERIPAGSFHLIKKGESLPEVIGNFDLIICNFVLLENESAEIQIITNNIHAALNPEGMAIVTNCTAKTYRSSNSWYSLNNNFPENQTLSEGQSVKLELSDKKTQSTFIVWDFFHSGSSYRNAYQKSGLHLAETIKPLGNETDGIEWKSEKNVPPYKIHILHKKSEFNWSLRNYY